jgi:hypothetical protein
MQEQPDPVPDVPSSSFFTINKFILGGIACFMVIIVGIGLFMFLPTGSSSKKIAPTQIPTPTVTLIPTKKPTIYPTSYPPVTSVQKIPTPTSKPSQNSGSQTTSSAIPTPTPTPTATTGSISGGYYDASTHNSLNDSMFAVASQDGPTYARSDDKPTWTLSNLKPGHYHVTINVDSSKYNQRTIVCKNCTISNIQFAGFEVDLKAGDSIQIEWLFDPK